MIVPLPVKIAGLTIRSPRDLAVDPNLKFCGLITGPPKMGKTTLISSFAKAIAKHENKPSVNIVCEPSDGGGMLSVADSDLAYVQPTTLDQCRAFIAGLYADRTFGLVALDNVGELVASLLKPVALQLPSKENTATRTLGVPDRSDYQTMAELFRREVLLPLINLSKHPDPAIRKHVILTTLPKDKLDKTGSLIKVLPDLPGAMALTTQALVQYVGELRFELVKDKRPDGTMVATKQRFLCCERDELHDYDDRYKIFGGKRLADMEKFWDEVWIPRQRQAVPVVPTTLIEEKKEQKQ